MLGRAAVHLVDLEALALGRSRRVARSRRRHPGPEDHPFARRHVPSQRAVGGDCAREILHCRSRDGEVLRIRLGLRRPEIRVPHGKRRRVHLPELLLDEVLEPRGPRQANFGKRALVRDAGEDEAPALRGRRRKRHRRRALRHGADVDGHVGAVEVERPNAREGAVAARGEKLAGARPGRLRRVERETARARRLGKLDIDREGVRAAAGVAWKRELGVERTVEESLDARRRGCARDARRAGADGVRVGARRRERRDRDLLKRLLGSGQLPLETRRARDARLRRHEVAHRLAGFDPRPARLAPARAVEHADADARTAALADGVLDELPPLVAEHLHPAGRDVVEEDVADEGLADAGARHGLEVARDSLLRDRVADPVPVDPRLGRVGRVREAVLEARRGGEGRKAGDDEQRSENDARGGCAVHGFLGSQAQRVYSSSRRR